MGHRSSSRQRTQKQILRQGIQTSHFKGWQVCFNPAINDPKIHSSHESDSSVGDGRVRHSIKPCPLGVLWWSGNSGETFAGRLACQEKLSGNFGGNLNGGLKPLIFRGNLGKSTVEYRAFSGRLLGSSKRHLPKGHPWILLELHWNFQIFTRISLEFY